MPGTNVPSTLVLKCMILKLCINILKLFVGRAFVFYLDFTIKRLYSPSPMERDRRGGHCEESDQQLGRPPGVPEVGGGRDQDRRLSDAGVGQEWAIGDCC